MTTVPIEGTMQSVTFFQDDTIGTVRQLIAVAMGSHPDRMFVEVKARLPADYYATNPLHWTNLFLRLSLDGERITADRLQVYLTQIRLGTGISPQEITKDEWEDHIEVLKPIYDPENAFDEWRILGVDEVHSFVMPHPPIEITGLQAKSRPIPAPQSLYETLHPYEVGAIRVEVVGDKPAPNVLLNYFPLMRADTPLNIQSMKATLEKSHSQLQALLDLDTPKHESVSIVRAKWYIPFISTKFTAPRNRFEQVFYGLTVSPETPYIGYFTAKTETTRHKFFVPNPKEKKPLLDISMWKGWTNNTQPQRRLPTLLLYRGTSRMSFDRIAITDRDITVDVRRERGNTETIEELQLKAFEWLKTFDGLVPFLTMTDVEMTRWNLADLSVLATYAKDINEFDTRRFPCLQSVFAYQNDVFRLLRADHTADNVSAEELRALQILGEDEAEQSSSYLAREMGITEDEAGRLFTSVMEKSAEQNFEKTMKAYPSIKFSNKEVIITFVTNLERTLHYADILRHVLTSDSEDVNAVCPLRMETVAPTIAVPQTAIVLDLVDGDQGFMDMLDFGEDTPEETLVIPTEAPKSKKVRVAAKQKGTYNYFNGRLQAFDADTFDKSVYPGKCDKPKQAVVLTPEDKARIGEEYDYGKASDQEKLELKEPEGTVVCPPYWCMRDEIPLREDQMVVGDDAALHCPKCNGKVRVSDIGDTIEFSVIKRDTSAKFPDYIKAVSSINKRKIPCCFQTPRSSSEVLAPKEEPTYVLDVTTTTIPALRFAYLPPVLAEQLSIKLDYGNSVKKGRLGSDQNDIFRVGLGRPSKTLPVLLGDATTIKRPRDAKDNVMRCSFFRTWKARGPGDTQVDKIISSIDSAFQSGDLGMLEELEYVTSFLKCEVIRINTNEPAQVECGFWSDSVGGSSRTIVLIGSSILAHVSRMKDKKSFKSKFTTDLRDKVFKSTLPILRDLHRRACSVNVPILADAITELQLQGKTQYKVILDPFNRIQAVFVPKEILLPVQPSSVTPDAGVPVLNGYDAIEDSELPNGAVVRAFLAKTKHEKFKVQAELSNEEGDIVELELKSGFRVPIEPEEGNGEAREVIQTILRIPESQLTDGAPNAEDLRIAREISYSAEIYEFLLYSLSKDVAEGEDFGDLREMIVRKDKNLFKQLTKWFDKQAYADDTKSPLEFVNKVRTPCGQFTKKDTCSKSSLCGWHKNSCKIKVKKSIVEKDAVLKRIAKTLHDNDKQRALVLDGRLSPFFSTILYLEMPHELITTVI